MPYLNTDKKYFLGNVSLTFISLSKYFLESGLNILTAYNLNDLSSAQYPL